MQINWEDAINNIFVDRLTCPRCGEDRESLVVGYSRKPELNLYAPRHRECPRGADCDARKLITLCAECARAERLRGNAGDASELLETYMLDCRRDLEESLDYVAEYWRDEIEVGEDDLDRSLAEIEPEIFAEESEWRRRLGERVPALPQRVSRPAPPHPTRRLAFRVRRGTARARVRHPAGRLARRGRGVVVPSPSRCCWRRSRSAAGPSPASSTRMSRCPTA